MKSKQENSKRCLIICPNPSMDIQASITEFVPKTPTRIQEEKFFPGGKGTHVAMALSEMDVPCTLLGIWSSQNGSGIKNACLEYYPNIGLEGPTVDGFNRHCYSFISDGLWSDTELLGAGPLVEENIYKEIIKLVESQKNDLAAVAICGSWPKGASEFSTQKIVEKCTEYGIATFIDTTGPQLSQAINSKPYLIHLNRKEICDFYGTSFPEALAEISKKCEVAAITDGAKGLYYRVKDQTWHSSVLLDEEILSTVGCGDCLLAGIIKAYYLKYDEAGASKIGAAAGAANCLRRDLGMLYKADVTALMSRVRTNLL